MCANLTLTLSVEKIVIGGGVMNRGEVLFEHIRRHFALKLKDYLKHPKLEKEALKNYIVRSKFENDLGMISSAAVSATSKPWSE